MTDFPPPSSGADPSQPENETPERVGWDERVWAARLVGVIIYLVPFVVSVAAAFFLSSLLPQAPNLAIGILRWLGIAIVSTVVLMVVERQTRRLMPLKTLLGLSLNFPDKAPSRFKIAIRTGTTNQLRERLDEAREGRLGDTPSEAAERLLELVGMLSQHDRLTRGHSERVRAYSHMIGEELGMSGRELDRLRWAGLLHDVGKLAISPDVLNKPGKLTAEEFELIKSHPMEGKKLVEPLAGWLGEAARAVWEHHERYDGGGYPMGLAGTEISRAARIVSVADVFDVITSVRSYKLATSASEAREELAKCAGSQFDPEVVRAFLALSVGRVRRTIGPLSWVTQLALFPGAIAAQAAPALASAAVVTAGAAAGTVGIAADPQPAIAQARPIVFLTEQDRVEFGATPSSTTVVIEQAAPLPTVAATTPPTVVIPATTTTTLPPTTATTLPPTTTTPAPPATVAPIVSAVSTTTTTTTLPPTTTTPAPPATVAPVVSAVSTTTTTTTLPPTTTTTTTTTLPPPPTTTTTLPPTTTTTTTTTTLPPTTTTTTTTTLPPPTTTTTTTTLPPPTTTTTTTTLPPPTTTTTTTTLPPPTTTTTTTTLPPADPVDIPNDVYLEPGPAGNTTSSPELGLTYVAPTRIFLYNYDTDRNNLLGLIIGRSAAGVDTTDVNHKQVFVGQFQERTRIDTDNARFQIDVAASTLSADDVHIEARLELCSAAGPCTRLGQDDRVLNNASA